MYKGTLKIVEGNEVRISTDDQEFLVNFEDTGNFLRIQESLSGDYKDFKDTTNHLIRQKFLTKNSAKPMDIMYFIGPHGNAVCTQVRKYSPFEDKHFVANYNKFLSHSARNMLARFLYTTNFADNRGYTYLTRSTINSVTSELRAIKKELAFVKRVRNHGMLGLNNSARNYQKDLKDLKKVLTRLNVNLLHSLPTK
jgi:virulence-associated protein VapD